MYISNSKVAPYNLNDKLPLCIDSADEGKLSDRDEIDDVVRPAWIDPRRETSERVSLDFSASSMCSSTVWRHGESRARH